MLIPATPDFTDEQFELLRLINHMQLLGFHHAAKALLTVFHRAHPQLATPRR